MRKCGSKVKVIDLVISGSGEDEEARKDNESMNRGTEWAADPRIREQASLGYLTMRAARGEHGLERSLGLV